MEEGHHGAEDMFNLRPSGSLNQELKASLEIQSCKLWERHSGVRIKNPLERSENKEPGTTGRFTHDQAHKNLGILALSFPSVTSRIVSLEGPVDNSGGSEQRG